MSEEKNEKKPNANQGGHRPRHHYHKHKSPNSNNNQANAEKKDNAPVKPQQPRQQHNNAPKTNQPQAQKAPAGNNEGTEAQAKGENKKKNRNQRYDKRQNREQSRSVTESDNTFSAIGSDLDPIISIPLFSSQSKEKKISKAGSEPLEIRPLSDEELFGTAHLIYRHAPAIEASTEIVGIRFKSGGKVYYFDPNGLKVAVNDHVVVDTARGLEFGEVYISNRHIASESIVQPLRKVIRIATKEDINHHNSNKLREKDAFRIGLEKIAAHKLDMKLVDVQYSFDNSKLLFYFTSAGRVDFRELVRDLASVFKTRIELRQIGIRDEAKLLGGIGMCGRPLCCSRHLSNFAQVSIKMAKEQGLSLNANKISGNCGRLMCCLNFENQVYIDEIKVTPMPGSIVKVGREKGSVTDANPLTGMLKVHLDGTPEGERVNIHRDEVTIISRKLPESFENDSKEGESEEEN